MFPAARPILVPLLVVALTTGTIVSPAGAGARGPGQSCQAKNCCCQRAKTAQRSCCAKRAGTRKCRCHSRRSPKDSTSTTTRAERLDDRWTAPIDAGDCVAARRSTFLTDLGAAPSQEAGGSTAQQRLCRWRI